MVPWWLSNGLWFDSLWTAGDGAAADASATPLAVGWPAPWGPPCWPGGAGAGPWLCGWNCLCGISIIILVTPWGVYVKKNLALLFIRNSSLDKMLPNLALPFLLSFSPSGKSKKNQKVNQDYFWWLFSEGYFEVHFPFGDYILKTFI